MPAAANRSVRFTHPTKDENTTIPRGPARFTHATGTVSGPVWLVALIGLRLRLDRRRGDDGRPVRRGCGLRLALLALPLDDHRLVERISHRIEVLRVHPALPRGDLLLRRRLALPLALLRRRYG